ncbi:DNA polymerase III subunit delta' [Clostridium polyendosporum]|uniref:DNA polymerase III subunit delta' n=1 Tax=Clostridium polyendosporum TaxID=69208 RepID=A0A919S0T6_9CLOT|nr:DNA polymerase III subunit delta' [Clostridium polyendosporum]GIM30027.1 DNA polymerase III subunit delta' [Clostridium polyendosporum]
MSFIGHEAIRERFNKSIKNSALSHAHLIIGDDGIGKSILAKDFAVKILGREECRDYVDIVNYKPKKGSFGVDEVREIISEVNKKPYEGDKKVIIIYDGNKLTTQAQNALLKTIEEPPKGVYMILLCESTELILDTIKSRCQIHKLSPLSLEEMENFIEKNYEALDEKVKKTLLAFSEGIPGRVQKFLEDKSFEEVRNIVLDMLKDINKRDEKIIIEYEQRFTQYNDKEEEILSTIVSFVRDIIVYKEIENLSMIINGDKIDDIKDLSNLMSYKKLKAIVGVVDDTRKNFKSNTNSSMTFNVMLISLLEV